MVWGEAVELLDRVYSSTDGEVTDEVEAVEWWQTLAADEALEAICRFLRFLDSGDAAIARERERLDRAAERIAKRRQWAEGIGLQILESLGVKSKAVGPFRAKSRAGRERLDVDASVFVLDEAPDEIVRIKPPVEAKRELDKTAAKAYLKRNDSMPVPGLSIGRGPSSFAVD